MIIDIEEKKTFNEWMQYLKKEGYVKRKLRVLSLDFRQKFNQAIVYTILSNYN